MRVKATQEEAGEALGDSSELRNLLAEDKIFNVELFGTQLGPVLRTEMCAGMPLPTNPSGSAVPSRCLLK